MTQHKKKLKALLLEGLDDETVQIFQDKGIEIEFFKRAFLEEELIERIKDVDILGIRTRTPVTKRVLAKANKLRVIGAFCTGTEHVDREAARKKGIQVFHSPFGSTRSVVELVIGCMIMLARQVPDKNKLMHEGIWDKSYKGCHEIKGKTLGIIGYGHIGTTLSVVAEALGMQVCFYDTVDRMPYGNTKACQSLEELLAISDVITLHVDGREENNNLIGEKEFIQMKDGVLFINASRGQVVDYDALVTCIKNGKVAGAALDVFINNPLARGDPFVSPLQQLPNVILTPHLGGSTEEALRARGLYVAKRIIKFLDEEVT